MRFSVEYPIGSPGFERGGSIFSYGDNRVDGNTTNSAFTLPVIVTH